MRAGAVVSIVVLSLVSLSARGGTVDLRARLPAGEGPAPHAGLWLIGAALADGLERERVVLDQRNIRFEPRVLAVQTGTTVEMPNNDRVLHNVFSFRDGKRFDLGITYSVRLR